MKLYATTQSERGKNIGKGGNEFVLTEFTVGTPDNIIGQVELYLFDDDKKYGDAENEWILKWRRGGDDDDEEWDIIAQGHIPSTMKKKK